MIVVGAVDIFACVARAQSHRGLVSFAHSLVKVHARLAGGLVERGGVGEVRDVECVLVDEHDAAVGNFRDDGAFFRSYVEEEPLASVIACSGVVGVSFSTAYRAVRCRRSRPTLIDNVKSQTHTHITGFF